MENARPSSISITITPQILTDLVYCYEAVSDLEDVITKLYGELIIPGIGEGILGNLSRIYNVLPNLIKVHPLNVDFDQSEFGKIMESDLNPEEKAARLLDCIFK